MRHHKSNKSVEPINYPAGNLLAHFIRYTKEIKFESDINLFKKA
jgi:hypothetical protein